MSLPDASFLFVCLVYCPRPGKKSRAGELNTADYAEAEGVVFEVRVHVYEAWGRELAPLPLARPANSTKF